MRWKSVLVTILLGGVVSLAAADDLVHVDWTSGWAVEPSVAHDAVHDEYFVTWSVDGDGGGSARSVVQAAVYDRWGSLIAGPWPVSDGSFDCFSAVAAYDPGRDRYFVVWVQATDAGQGDYDSIYRLVPSDGPASEYPETEFFPSAVASTRPRIDYSAAADGFGVVMTLVDSATGDKDVNFTFHDAANLAINAWGIIDPNAADRQAAAIAANRQTDDFLVVYELLQSASNHDIYARLVDLTTFPVMGAEVGIAGWGDFELTPDVAARADDYVVAWIDPNDDVWVRPVNPAGAPAGGPVLVASTSVNSEARIQCNPAGRECVTVWTTLSAVSRLDVLGAHLDRALTTFDPFILRSTTTLNAHLPALAGGSGTMFVAWQETLDTGEGNISAYPAPTRLFAGDFESGGLARWSQQAP